MAGATVAAFFFLGDLLHLDPLATPEALGQQVLGSWGTQLDFPVVAQVAYVVTYGAKLSLLTVLHLLAFGATTAVAVVLVDRYHIPLNIVSGAVLGLVGYTAVFYLGTSIVSDAPVTGAPGLGGIAAANFLGGAIMGFYMQMGDW